MQSRKDVVFANAGGMELKLDITAPTAPSKHIAILFLHGGGWRQGTREMMAPMAELMAGYGYTGLASQYRLNGQKAVWPAHIHDVKAAIRWTRTHARELDIDPERIVLWGSSAGAHLALLAGGTPDDPALEGDVGPGGVSSKVAAVVAVHPPTGFHVGEAKSKHTTPANALMGDGASEEAARIAGPISYASADFPPALLLHGTQDRIVHHSQSQVMLDALRAARAPADLHLFHGHAHGFVAIPSVRKQVAAEAAYFLDRTVVDPQKYKDEAEQVAAAMQRLQQARAAAQ